MPNIHPLIIHFPIALILVILACDAIGLFFKKKSLFDVGTILSVFALAGAAAALISGLLAEDSAWKISQAHELLEDHETAAWIFLGFMAMYTAFRIVFRRKISESLGWLSLLLALWGSLIVARVGYLGGEMVFHYGTGVQQAEIQTNRADSLATIIDPNFKPSDKAANKPESEHKDTGNSGDHH
jgi:uncharacterized membrane protein